MLAKLLPLLVAAGGVYKNQDKIKQLFDFSAGLGSQMEMATICKVIHLDSLDGSIPSSDLDSFAAYIRANIKPQKGQAMRDFSKDMWGTPYRLEVKKRVATVISAGPDKKFDTGDDVRASTDLF